MCLFDMGVRWKTNYQEAQEEKKNWTTGKKRMSKGYTMIELVVVIILIGILSAVAVPRFERSVFWKDHR